MIVTPLKTRIFRENESLEAFINRYVPRLRERDILVVTSKIVALAEKRTSDNADKKTKARLIRAESEWAMPTKYAWLTIKDGTVMAGAGIDESNADGKLILLPKDSFRVAAKLRAALRKRHGLRHLGVIITDSRLLPLRSGVVGVALGYAGFRGIRDYRGKPDLFGRRMRLSQTDVADSLATAAVLTMGEGRERRPLALIQDAPVKFRNRVRRNELHIDPRNDLYRPLFRNL